MLPRNVVAAMSAGILAVAVASCGSGDRGDVAIPRPKGYPRLPEIGSEYHGVEGLSLYFEVNNDATVSRETRSEGVWLTVDYPMYDAQLYCTFTPVSGSDYGEVVDNRVERMSLNFAGARTKMTPVTADDGVMSGEVYTTRERCAFPVQFIVTGSGMVVSGSLFMPSMTVNPDSVAPAAEAVTRDIVHALRRLR